MLEKFVTKGWRNVRSVHIKGPNTLALPIWLARELWVEEADVLEEAEAARTAEGAAPRGKRKRKEIEQSEGKEIEAEGVKKKKKNGERKAIKEATKS
jgi:ribosome biogenesis protein UTP30